MGRQPPGWQLTFDAVALSLLQRLGQKGEVHRASFIREVSDERDARSVLTMLAQVRLVENTISALPRRHLQQPILFACVSAYCIEVYVVICGSAHVRAHRLVFVAAQVSWERDRQYSPVMPILTPESQAV